MFDSLNITKSYKITDNITGCDVEVATFNAILNKNSNISVFMNINYPNLYGTHKNDILTAYREFNAEVASLACTMELSLNTEASVLKDLEPIQNEFKEKALKVFTQIIDSLGDVRVNPVPIIDATYRY